MLDPVHRPQAGGLEGRRLRGAAQGEEHVASVQKKAGADALLQSVRVLWFLERQEWGICAFDFFVHAPHYRRPRHAQVDLRLERLAVKGAALRLDSLLVGAEAERVLVARGLTRARARGAGPEAVPPGFA
jgi:hypothetical protein